MSVPGGCPVRGCLALGGPAPAGVSTPGGSDPGGVSATGGSALGGGIPACTEADPPPVNRMTDRCKNTTFATSLRTVTRPRKQY